MAAIRALGGYVLYDYSGFGEQRVGPFLGATPQSWAPRFLRDLAGDDFFHAVIFASVDYSRVPSQGMPSMEQVGRLTKLIHLDLKDVPVNDDDLKYLRGLRRLRHLEIGDGVNVSDEGIRHLAPLRELRTFSIRRAQITDASLEVISEWRELEELNLYFHQFTDEGVPHLGRLKNLRKVILWGYSWEPSDITDDSLAFLLKLPKFDMLDVRFTRVSADFAERFKAHFPQGRIHVDTQQPQTR